MSSVGQPLQRHFKTNQGQFFTFACGTPTTNNVLDATTDPLQVTCKKCKKTFPYRRALAYAKKGNQQP